MISFLKKKTIWIPFSIVIAFLFWFFLLKKESDNIIYVDVEEVQRRDVVQKVNASGKIQPEEAVQITSTITGWITKITVIEGDTVNPGQHLISIDEKQIRPTYDNALSQVKSSKANLKKIEAQMERTNSLYSEKLISKQELEQIQASYQIALSQSDQAKANLLSAKDQLSKTRLTAPKYGIVTSITKEEGEMAVGGMFNPGVLMTIADLSKMEVEVDVNENDVVNIEIGDTTEIEIDAYPDTTFYGLISEIAHSAQSLNMGSQQQVTNFKVKVKMLSVPDRVRPGMSSTVNIITETIKDVISIPIQALTSRSDDYELEILETDEQKNNFKKANPIDVIFVLENEFKGNPTSDNMKYAVIKPIQIGISGENYYSVKSGVKEGDLIVIGGYRLVSKDLKHGDLVSMKDEKEN